MSCIRGDEYEFYRGDEYVFFSRLHNVFVSLVLDDDASLMRWERDFCSSLRKCSLASWHKKK